MSNYTDVKTEVKNYICARTPLIIIETSERERAERMLSQICRELTTEMYYYTEARQVTRIGTGNGESFDVSNDPLAYAAELFVKKRKTIFCYGDVHRISDDSMNSREIINILYSAVQGDSTLILITKDPVYSRIAQFGLIARLDYPTLDERCELISGFINAYANRYPIEWQKDDIVHAATLLRGFSEIQINNILSNEIVAEQGLFIKNLRKLTCQKSKLYASVPNVQLVNVPEDIHASGLENLKEWLDEKKRIFFASDEELSTYDLKAPKGILLSGVPGCGKSYSAKLISASWGLPLFRFDAGSVYDKWMGESERKMKEALDFIDNVAPCVLWIDEVEKALSSSSDNDTGKRILGQFLFWLQESESRVFLVATANDISLLPAELFRKGRFSEIFFVDLPTARERQEVIEYYVRKCLHLRLKDEQLSELIALSDGFSYSEIEYAVKEVAQILLLYGTEHISMDTIRDKFSTIVPIQKSNPELVRKIRQWGKERAIPAFKTIKGSDQYE